METKVFKNDLSEAAELIRAGALVAVPTETVYGLAGNGLDEGAVRDIYEVKGRPAVKPLSLMVPGREAMDLYCDGVPAAAKALAGRFWPGPLTIVLRAKRFIPPIVLAGGDTVGLRCPDHPMTLELLRLAGVPFAAPSANPSGEPSPKNARTVLDYFDGKIAAVVDGGECGIGTESTLISMAQTPYRILRQGALPAETVADALVDEMTVIGITGGTGSGKTTALHCLEALGALVIDCDEVYHALLSENGEMLAEICGSFPEAVVDGAFDRKALGAAVFGSAAALERLNAITHRYVSERVRSMLREHAMNGGTLAAVDAIELISSGLAARCDATVGVVADRETRIRRIMERDGISRPYAESRVDAQHGEEYFRRGCDHILENNSDPEEFTYNCNKLFKEIIKHG